MIILLEALYYRTSSFLFQKVSHLQKAMAQVLIFVAL